MTHRPVDTVPRRPCFGSNPSEKLLIECVRWPRSAGGIDAIRAAAQGIDWAHFTALVQRHRVAALTLDALDRSKIETPAALKAIARAAIRTSLGATAEAIRLGAVLDRAGLAVAVLKGPVVAQRYYGAPTMRDYHDLDLLIDPAHLTAALALLKTEGYRQINGPPHNARPAVIAYWQVAQKDVALVCDARQVMVELHYRLWANPHTMAPLAIGDTTESISIGGAQLRCFDDALCFSYLAAHGAGHRFRRLKWLADIQAIRATTGDDELQRLLATAERVGAGASARLALALSARLFGEPPPPAIADAIAADGNIARRRRSCERALAGSDTQARGFATIIESWRELTFSAAPGYRRWQLSTRLRDWRMAALLPLPRALHFAYLPLNLLRWLIAKLVESARPSGAAGRGKPRA